MIGDGAHGTWHGGYRHEALFYDGVDGFLAGIVPFIGASLEAGEPLLAVLAAPKIAALRDLLGADAERVRFADMAKVGTNPARIIPAWRQFLIDHAANDGGRPVRGIGEPVWAGRSPAAMAECERHEALLNAAFAGLDFWLLCPYDTSALPGGALDEARRNHPFICDGAGSHASERFPGVQALTTPDDRPLHEPPERADQLRVNRATLPLVRHVVALHAERARLSERGTAEIVLTVNELVTNTLRHGGGEGTLLLWHDADAVICEIRDRGHIEDPLVGRREPSLTAHGGRGLWIANQLCELVQIRNRADGTVVRVHKRHG